MPVAENVKRPFFTHFSVKHAFLFTIDHVTLSKILFNVNLKVHVTNLIPLLILLIVT